MQRVLPGVLDLYFQLGQLLEELRALLLCS